MADEPCAECPIRDRPNRAYVRCAQAAFRGGDHPFPCHLTLDCDEDGEYDIDTESQEVCRGYLLVNQHAES